MSCMNLKFANVLKYCEPNKLTYRLKYAQQWLGAKPLPQKCRLAPTAKHTGQESGGKLCEIIKKNFDRFCSHNL